MTISKLTNPPSQKGVIDKINEIIDDFTLDELKNVSISSPSAGQNLTYDATNQVWKNTSTSATVAWGGITGTLADQTDLQNALNGKQATLTEGTGISISSSTISATDPVLINNAAGSSNGVAIKGSGTVQSTQIGALGSASSMSTSVGFSSYASGSQSISIGHGSQATAAHSYSFGEQAKSTAKGAFQFGYGTNNEAGTVQFGLNTGDNNSDTVNYKLLGSDGIIPNARINMDATPTSASSNTITSGAVYTALSGKQDTIDANNKLDYSYLSNTPTIPTVNNATLTITQGGVSKGTFTANASSDVTIALDAGGGSSLTAGNGININESDEIDIIQQDTTGITTNYTVVGSPTISSSYVASGFSDSNYLTIHNPIVSANSFTMHFKFSITSVSTMGILDSDYATNNNSHTYRFTITSAGKLFFRCSRYGNDSYQLSITGTTVLSTNTIYYAKVEYDDVNGYKLYLSTDDTNWNLEASSSEIFKSSYLTSSFIFKIGDNSANGNSFQGSIYLEDAYIDVNGSRAWEAVAITPALTVAKATNTLYGLVKPDGTTITANNGVISAVVPTTIHDLTDDTATYPIDKADSVTNQNSGGSAIKTWTGTKAQYDAITTKDANTLYNITDDTDVTLSLLNLLYPIGAIYIGTCANCPLQVLGVGTWSLIATDRVLQGAGTRGAVGSTVNESLPNITGTSPSGAYWLASSTDLSTGSFYRNDIKQGNSVAGQVSQTYSTEINFDASRSNSTYQDDAPVQQDAYIVNIWERVA